MKYNIHLSMCKRSDPEYNSIRDRHYVANRGCVGRQLHYKIYLDNSLCGIISGASAVFVCTVRDNFFGINKNNVSEIVQNIICNNVFRIETNIPNLGSQILSLWRKTVVVDWEKKYKSKPIGFETFVFGEGRFGSMYKADNWTFTGYTTGSTITRSWIDGKRLVKIGSLDQNNKKLVFCRFI